MLHRASIGKFFGPIWRRRHLAQTCPHTRSRARPSAQQVVAALFRTGGNWKSPLTLRTKPVLLRQSVRKSVAILFRPLTVGWHRLHRRPTFGAAGTGPFHLGFSHAGAGLSFQAGADIN